MPVAAVPAYLGQDFSQSSPGLRFGLFLPVWNEHDLSLDKKANPLRQACKLTPHDSKILQALQTRQQSMARTVPDLLSLGATATAPFTTGLGNEHPLENGFAFLNPYGLPYLPGSSIKGVLRQAARELASGDWGASHRWVALPIPEPGTGRQPAIGLSVLDVLFGLESSDGDSDHVRGALSFWDAIPQIAGESLSVDIMTPHQGHYYQQGGRRDQAAIISPHDSGQPVPIHFLTIPPGSVFHFHIQCNLRHLHSMAPDLATDERWKALLVDAFEHAFDWLGFGAKTSVGYGAMMSLAQQERRQAEIAAQQKAEKRRREIEAEQQRQQNAEMWPGAQIHFNRANGSLIVKKRGQSATALAPTGEALLQSLPASLQKRIRSNQFVKVNAYVAERVLVRVAPE